MLNVFTISCKKETKTSVYHFALYYLKKEFWTKYPFLMEVQLKTKEYNSWNVICRAKEKDY